MKHTWNITGTKKFVDKLKQSKYYKQSLGQSLTVEKNGGRKMRQDVFTSWYYKNSKALIFKQGEIGNIHFYIDYYLKEDVVGFFLQNDLDKHQYAINWEEEEIEENGIDNWLSNKLKEIDEQILESDLNKENKDNIIGDENKLQMNPGSVNWKDIEAFYKKKKQGIAK
jgi:hypothetical protein